MQAYLKFASRLCCCAIVAMSARASAAESKVSGTLSVGDEKIALKYAYVDEAQPAEPIIVLSDQPLPAKAIPFIPEKLVDEQKIHAIAFSVSAADKTWTNTFGKLYLPGHGGVGLGSVEDGNETLVIKSMDSGAIEGTFATRNVVHIIESVPPYSFNLSFSVSLVKGAAQH